MHKYDSGSSKTGIHTDLYQLTMAQGYWKKGLAERRAAFYSTFRMPPFNGGFTLFCGLENFSDFLERFGFSEDDTKYLSTLKNPDGTNLFEDEFLGYLENMTFSCDVFSPPEGSIVFPATPIIRIEGPLIQCQILETPLLNIINHQTLIATKAARVCLASGDQQVLEFGFRRAHGPDGALSCSRAAFIGGCSGTSNVLAGKKYGIPVMGTMAHSWIMLFDEEKEAFMAFADVSGPNFILLVDTYDTLSGVRNAVEIAKKMRLKGKNLAGVRLDSGDMTELSLKTRKILDDNGFNKTIIIASNDLDEYEIISLKKSGAPIDAWGVGTRLVTSKGHSALDGVYKLSAIQNEQGILEPRLKISDHPIKNSLPGILQTRRYKKNGSFSADIIHDANLTGGILEKAIDLHGGGFLPIEEMDSYDDLLKKVFVSGKRLHDKQCINEIRSYALNELKSLPPGTKNLISPAPYRIGIEEKLSELKDKLTLKHK